MEAKINSQRIGIARMGYNNPATSLTILKYARQDMYLIVGRHTRVTGDLEDIKAWAKASGYTLVPTNATGRKYIK